MPIREYPAIVQETENSEPVRITVLASPAIAQLPPDDARAHLNSLLSQTHGLRSAIVNRSKEEIDRIAEMLSQGRRPNADALLLQSARAALDRRDPLTAVIVAFQALEIYLETRLREGFQNRGLTDTQITRKLMGVVRTKDRLTGLCREVTGHSVADDTQFWNDWLTNCNRKRNEAVHRNLPVTLSEAERVVSLCQECIKRVGLLPFPP